MSDIKLTVNQIIHVYMKTIYKLMKNSHIIIQIQIYMADKFSQNSKYAFFVKITISFLLVKTMLPLKIQPVEDTYSNW